MKSLLTGSRIYGEPRPDSDLDMVVLVEDDQDIYLLAAMQSPMLPTRQRARNIGYNGKSVRYDRLNLILIQEPEIYEAWRKGTEFLKAIKPVTHEQACTVFETMFKIAREAQMKHLESLPF